MQYIFLSIIAIIFFYLNYKIIISDIKRKIIPNRYILNLLFLIPFYYIYFLIFSNIEVNYWGFLLQIFLTFFVSFILYYFGVWSAGDAKYLLVLSLFIPYIGIIIFIGNIALLTIFYLILYFLWFWFGKSIFFKGYYKNLAKNIRNDLKDKWSVFKRNKYIKGSRENTTKIFFVCLKYLVIFLIIFVSLRLARIYIFNYFFDNGDNIELVSSLFKQYHFYLLLVFILVFFGIIFLGKIFINKIKLIIRDKIGWNLDLVGNIFIIILFLSLSTFVFFEYLRSRDEISNLLFLIFTLYISIYLIIKIIIYSYKITFQAGEEYYEKINNLKEGVLINKEFLIKSFKNDGYIIKNGINLNSISKNIDKNEVKFLKNIYRNFNLYHKKNKTQNFEPFENVKIEKTTSFGHFIMLGFILTFLFQNKLIEFLINKVFNYINFWLH